jgi:hypothetical protein
VANQDAPNGFKYVKGEHLVMHIGLAATQVISKGDMIIEDTNGYGAIAASSSGQLLGLALHDADSTGEAAGAIDMEYIVATPATIFQGQCSGTLTQTMLMSDMDIEGTTGIMEVNENATTEQVIRIIEIPDTTEFGINEVGANSRVNFIVIRRTFDNCLASA